MSQYGAMGMAEAGFDYKEILKWYYTGVEIVPDTSEYIVIEDNKNNTSDDEIIINEKDYSVSNIKIVSQDEKGPLLQKILSTIESWR